MGMRFWNLEHSYTLELNSSWDYWMTSSRCLGKSEMVGRLPDLSLEDFAGGFAGRSVCVPLGRLRM